MRLHDVPVRRKLRLIILGSCTVSVCLASTALYFLQLFFFQRDYRRDLTTVAEVVGITSKQALSSESATIARDILSAVRNNPHIQGASILLPSGTVLAGFGNFHRGVNRELTTTDQFEENGTGMFFEHPVYSSGKLIGTVCLRADYQTEVMQLQGLHAGMLALVLATSLLVAWVVSWRLGRLISDPIQGLAETARQIAAQSDYSLRARAWGSDEVGVCTIAFNKMLEQLQKRDAALRNEIAERTRTEQEVQRLHGQLLDASRLAGMAEVATGVLHNVGNVLNSVNVSAGVIAEKLGHGRTSNLVKATHLLRSQNGNLHDFLTNDPKGRVLPTYLATASEHLEQERLEALAEVALLTKNVEHIKDIVAMQQNYARVSGVAEPLSVDAIIEDALSMNGGGLDRHGVHVTRDFQPVPQLTIDKHKVLQILVNLLRNARHALDEADVSEKQLNISLRQKDGRWAEIAVTDNGIGIPPTFLTRIFSHGFTTRKTGHGFGLHSSALAAQQMGGRLVAYSKGRGHGATFTLSLPLGGPRS